MDLRLQLDKLSTPEDIQKLVSIISELAESLDALYTEVAPNGNISARRGRIALYNNSGTYQQWQNVDGGTTWQRIDSSATGDMLYSDARFKIGSFTRDISLASGTQEITSVGFQAKAVIFLGVISGAPGATFGFDDGTIAKGICNGHNYQADNWFPMTTNSIYYFYDVSANGYGGKISTLGSDGFTITWVKEGGTPSGTLTVVYLALR